MRRGRGSRRAGTVSRDGVWLPEKGAESSMAKPKVTATDRLSNVMDVVELGRRTGLLLVERNAGPILEEGEVYFVSGSPIYAALGYLRGRDALSALAQWGECRFSFDPLSPQPIPNVSGVLPAVRPPSQSGYNYSMEQGPPNQGPGSGAGFENTAWGGPPSGYPSGGYSNSPSNYPNSSPSGNFGRPSGANGSGAWPGSFGASGPASGSGASWGASGAYPQQQSTPSELGSSTGPFGSSAPKSDAANQANQALLQRRPQRAPDVRDLINVVNAYNLSRAHRTMLLLADGEHTVLDLARLSGKPVEEVIGLLRDLEGQSLVYYRQ
jgi:hypothetical protein